MGIGTGQRHAWKRMLRGAWSMFFLALLVSMPPDARVLEEGGKDGVWMQSGEMGCSVGAACREWESHLERQGWTLKDSFGMGQRRQVYVWGKDGHLLTLLIWEKEIGRCGFSLNEGREETKGR